MAKGNANVDYKKLWKLLIDKDMKKTDLITVAGISSNVLAKLNKGEYVSMESIQKICKALGCDVGDICVMNEVEKKKKKMTRQQLAARIWEVPTR